MRKKRSKGVPPCWMMHIRDDPRKIDKLCKTICKNKQCFPERMLTLSLL